VKLSTNWECSRHSHVHDFPGGIGVLVANSANYGVIYNNEINNNGGIDRHGVGVSDGTVYTWILDNRIHDNSGDAIQFCHKCIVGPANVYIGRNVMYNDVENAIDIKDTRGPVVISQNEMYGYAPIGPSGNGDAVRLNDDGAQGEIWLLYNHIHDSTICIAPYGSSSLNFMIGNLLHDCPTAITTGADYVINNTIYNVQSGILSGEAKNNIVSNASLVHIGKSAQNCSHNLLWQNGVSPTVQTACTNQLVADPLFVNSSLDNFHLQANSPAVDTGLADHFVYSSYLTKYGLNIKVDFDGVGRPQRAGWDRGAYEFGTAASPPSAPTNLSIIRQ
jgi:hypothetical protein